MSFKIEFKKSAKTFEWEEGFDNLFDFAEAKGVETESNCRIGACGICKEKLLSGRVIMESEDALEENDREQNLILP